MPYQRHSKIHHTGTVFGRLGAGLGTVFNRAGDLGHSIAHGAGGVVNAIHGIEKVGAAVAPYVAVASAL